MLVSDTGMDIKTIWQALKELAEMGLITDTGQRAGQTKQVTVWQLRGVDSRHDNHTENGTVPKTEGFRFSVERIPKTDAKAFRKRNTEPTKEPTKEPINNYNFSARARQTEDKQPGGASSGGQGRHEGEPSKTVERGKRKQAITNDWQPGTRCLELLEQAGISADFARSLVGEFCLYWQERGEKRLGWDATFLNHAKAQWMREKRHQGGTNVTPLRPVPSGHRNGGGHFRTFEQMRAENSQRAIDEFLHGDNVGVIIDA